MYTLIKNTFPELVDTIKIQNGFIAQFAIPSERQYNYATILPDRIMVIYKDYIAVNNFDKWCPLFTYQCGQTNILLFKVIKIETPGNVFARFIPSFDYSLREHKYTLKEIKNNNFDYFNTEAFDYLEIALLINMILEHSKMSYISSSDLFSTEELNQMLPKDKIQELQNSNTQFLLSHTTPFEDVSTIVDNKNKKIIAEYINNKNNNKLESDDVIFGTIEPPNDPSIIQRCKMIKE